MPVSILHSLTQQQWLAERAKDVTSSEVAALFDMSPYLTAFELWHRKAGALAVQDIGDQRIRWGARLEAAIAGGIAEDNGWTIAPLKSYARSVQRYTGTEVSNRFGSSFDFEVLCPHRGVGLLEIKAVDFLIYRDKWTKDEAPAHIELQLQHQLEVYEGGYTWGAIAALVAGNNAVVHIREYDRAVGDAIRRKVAEFWKSVDENRAPEPKFPDDAGAMIRMSQYADPGKVFDGRESAEFEDWLELYQMASEREKEAKGTKETCKARILHSMGDAEKAVAKRFKVSAGMVGPAEVSYTREGYRNFRVSIVKEKA